MAARVAFEQLAATPTMAPTPPTLPPLQLPNKNKVSYKSRLHIYAQKTRLDLPIYTSIREGPSHAPHFQATVRIDGKIFKSEVYYKTLKEAEQAAAKVAYMPLPLIESPQGDCDLHKMLLEDFVQQEGWSLPKYITNRSEQAHGSSFSSVVLIENEYFKGKDANTKKKAESNAAMIALNDLEERKNGRVFFPWRRCATLGSRDILSWSERSVPLSNPACGKGDQEKEDSLCADDDHDVHMANSDRRQSHSHHRRCAD